MVFYAELGAGAGLVDVRAGDGRAWGVWVRAADRVVEDENAVCAGDVVEEGFFDLRVVVGFDAGVVGEVFLYAGWKILQHAEAVDVEVVLGLVASDVVDGYFVAIFAVVALRLAWWRLFYVVEGCGAIERWCVEC